MGHGSRIPTLSAQPRASGIEAQRLLKGSSKNVQGCKVTRTDRWRQKLFMILAVLAGVCFAIGHHFYYTRLDNEEAGDGGRQ